MRMHSQRCMQRVLLPLLLLHAHAQPALHATRAAATGAPAAAALTDGNWGHAPSTVGAALLPPGLRLRAACLASPPAPQVCLFLANLRGGDETDEGLRASCEQYGALERCFVVRAVAARLADGGLTP